MENIRKMSIGVIMMMVVFFALFIILTIETARTPYIDPLVLVIPFILFIWIILTVWGEFNPIHYNKNFLSIFDGVIGAVADGPIPASGGRVKYEVVMPKRYIPKNKEGYYSRGVKGFQAVMAAKVTFDVVDDKAFFNTIENKAEGAIIYWGKLDGSPVPSPYQALRAKMNVQASLLSNYATAEEKFRSISDMLSKSSNKEILNASQQISAVLKDLGEGRGFVIPMQMPQPYDKNKI